MWEKSPLCRLNREMLPQMLQKDLNSFNSLETVKISHDRVSNNVFWETSIFCSDRKVNEHLDERIEVPQTEELLLVVYQIFGELAKRTSCGLKEIAKTQQELLIVATNSFCRLNEFVQIDVTSLNYSIKTIKVIVLFNIFLSAWSTVYTFPSSGLNQIMQVNSLIFFANRELLIFRSAYC